jgi:hypothetical protein
MTRTQIVHIGMINSYNIITGKASIEQVLLSGIGFLAHPPDELEPEHIELVIMYFEQLEMYEICQELRRVFDENYHADGTPRDLECLCDYPKINEYSRVMRCGTCNNRLRK